MTARSLLSAFSAFAALPLLLLAPAALPAQGSVDESPHFVTDNNNTSNLPFSLNVAQVVDDPALEIHAKTRNACAILANSRTTLPDEARVYGAMLQTTHGNQAAGNGTQEFYGAAGYALLDPRSPGPLGRVRHMIGVIGQVYLSDFFSFSGGSEHFVEFAGAEKLIGGHFRVLMDNKNAALHDAVPVAAGIDAQVVFDNAVNEPYDVGGRVTNAVAGNFQVQMLRVRGANLPATAEIENAVGIVSAVQTQAPGPGYTAGHIKNAYGLVAYISDPQGALDPTGERVALWTFGGENRLDGATKIGGPLTVTNGPVVNQGTAWYAGPGDPNNSAPATTGALYSQTDAPADASPLWVGTPAGWRRVALE